MTDHLADLDFCKCKGCLKERANLQKHLEHPFYKKVDDITGEVAIKQIIKGANTYDEPFSPGSWSGKELLMHLLEELRDGQVYGVGLFEKIEELEAGVEKGKAAIVENCELRKEIEKLNGELIAERGLHLNYKRMYKEVSGITRLR